MYKPNFILIGGVANKVNKVEKDFVAERQLNGDYDSIGDILMNQFMNLSKSEGDRGYEKSYAKGPSNDYSTMV